MKPTRVIMLSYERGFLEPASDASRRLASLASGDARVTAIVLSSAQGVREQGSVRVIGFAGASPLRVWRVLRATMREVRAARTAGESPIISAQDPFIAGLIAFKVSRWLDVPYEVQEHGDFFSGQWERERPFWNRCLARIGKFVMRRADGVRVVSERVRDDVMGRCGVAEDRVSVIPVIQDLTSLLQRQPRAWPEVPMIVVPCRFVVQKGLDVLLDAFVSLKQSGVNFRARLIGAGPLREDLLSRIVRLGLSGVVTIEPWSTSELLWKDADLFVMSSRYEGWGRTIVEAMAARVPIVTTEVGCVGSFFRPQIDGRVVQPNDASGLSAAIREQLTEKERREWMVAQAYERVQSVSSPSDLIERQHQAWVAVETRKPEVSRRAWVSTALVMGFAVLIHAASVILFWRSLAHNIEWGFMTLVQHWFQGFGYSFATQLGCASASRAPGFLFFLTAVYGIFGLGNFFAQAVIQNILAVLLTYLVYRLGWALTKDRRVGLLAAFIVTAHPYTFYHYTQYYHTVLSGLFLVSLLLAVLRLEATKRYRWAVLGGVMIAALAYIQGTILPATVFISLWLLIRWRNEWRKAIIAIAIMGMVSVGLIAPWTYRNWTVFHRFVPLTTDLGYALFKANNEVIYEMTKRGYPQEYVDVETVSSTAPGYVQYRLPAALESELAADGVLRPSIYWTEWHPRPPTYDVKTCTELGPLGEVDFNTYWSTRANDWIVHNWWTEGAKLQLLKVWTFWQPGVFPTVKTGAQWPFASNALLVWLANTVTWCATALIVFGGWIGLLLSLKRRTRGAWLVLSILCVYTFMHTFFAGYTKYRIPLDNVMAVFAAVSIMACVDALRKKRSSRKRT